MTALIKEDLKGLGFSFKGYIDGWLYFNRTFNRIEEERIESFVGGGYEYYNRDYVVKQELRVKTDDGIITRLTERIKGATGKGKLSNSIDITDVPKEIDELALNWEKVGAVGSIQVETKKTSYVPLVLFIVVVVIVLFLIMVLSEGSPSGVTKFDEYK
jgi:hypothetical protein